MTQTAATGMAQDCKLGIQPKAPVWVAGTQLLELTSQHWEEAGVSDPGQKQNPGLFIWITSVIIATAKLKHLFLSLIHSIVLIIHIIKNVTFEYMYTVCDNDLGN